MTEYIKFWLAKELVELGLGLGLLAVIVSVMYFLIWWKK